MKTHIMLHDADTNYPMIVQVDNISVVERAKNDESGKARLYFIYPAENSSDSYQTIMVNETVEKIYGLING